MITVRNSTRLLSLGLLHNSLETPWVLEWVPLWNGLLLYPVCCTDFMLICTGSQGTEEQAGLQVSNLQSSSRPPQRQTQRCESFSQAVGKLSTVAWKAERQEERCLHSANEEYCSREKYWPLSKACTACLVPILWLPWQSPLGESLLQVANSPSGSQSASLHCPLRVAAILLQDASFALDVSMYTLMNEWKVSWWHSIFDKT